MRKIVSLCLMLFVSMMMWANKTLYLMPNSNWLSANAKFAVYYYDNSTNTNGWSDIMTAVEGEENLFMTTVPETFPKIIFVRLSNTATEGSWAQGVKWNQSNDLDMPTGTLNCYYMGEADVWDYPAGRWMTYGNVEPQQQDTTNVSPLADKHFYLNGEFLNWDTQKALEFTLADSLFTLTVDTLSGIFKVMTARNWEAPDYGGDYNVNLTLGVPYTLTERGYDLSCSTIYLNAELQLRLVGNDVILTLVSGTPVQQDTTGTPEPIATPHFYLTGNEAFVGAGKAAWIKEDGYVSYGDTLTLTLAAGTYEVQLINANDEWKGYDALSQPIAENITTNSWGNICFYMAQAGQVTFIYKTDNTFLIQGTFAIPRYHFYYIGNAINWIVDDALEFEYQDSVYTLSLATLEGEFKIMTARDWSELSFGRNSSTEYITPGVPYEMTAWTNANIVVNGTLSNVTLQLTYVNQVATITVIENNPGGGGEQPQDTTSVTPGPQDTTEVAMITYYAVNSPRWPMPYAYVWKGESDAYKPWPGETMTRTGENFRGYEVYSYTMPAEYTKMIINNGKGGNNNQTPDMVLDTTLRYMYNLQWYASLDSIPAEQQDTTGTNPQDTTIVPPVVDTHYYIKNNWNGGEWTWQPMVAVESVNEDTTILLWSYTDVFGGTGVNISVSDNNEAPIEWYEIADFIIADGDLIPQAMDSVTFIYDAGSHHVHAFVINRPGDQPVDPQPVVNDITVYTVMPEGWGALNAYIWIGNQGYVAWPGEAMTNTGETFRGETVYSYTFPETYTSIIFNNGNGEQTIDLTIDTTKLYYYGETWYASWDEVPEEVIILPATYYVSGNENLVTAAGLSPDYAWNAAAIKATSDTLVLNLRANTDYKLRLTLNGTWVSDVKDYYYLTEVTPGLTTDIEANICFTPAEDGPVTIIYNDSVFTVQGNFIVFAKPTYYIKNNWEAGADWTWQQMNAIDNDSIYWGYVGVFGGMGVNIATEGSDSAPTIWFDASSFIVEEGDLIPQPLDTVYFVFDALRETLIAAVINRPGGVEPQPQPETHFYLVGQFNGWDLETAPEFARQDSFVYTMTVDTLFGAMKVVVSRDSWEGNYGVADMNDAVLTMGQTKALVPYLSGISDNFNFSVEGIILNAVLNIVVTDNVVNITLVSGTPYQQPIEDRHFYLVGSFNDWTVTEAPEFTLQDSIYTITIDTMAGEFKVTDARDWLHNIYGAYYYGEVLTPGNEYGMAAMNSENFSLITTYTNVTLNLRVENDVVTIIFVSGTQMPTTGLDTTVGNTAAPVKLIENGALIILRDGVKYNAAGQRIR